MAIVWTVTRRDSRGFTTAGSAVTFTVAVGPRGPAGPAGPNQVSDATTLGTLTDAVADALALLATNAAGTAARKVAITNVVRALLQATTEAQARTAIGTDAAGDPRPPTSHTHPASAISDSTAVGRAVLTAADAAAARTGLGVGSGDSPTFTGVTLSGLTGNRVPFAGTGGVLSSDGFFYYDSGNGRLFAPSVFASGNVEGVYRFVIGQSSFYGAQLFLKCASATDRGITIRGFTGQTAPLLELMGRSSTANDRAQAALTAGWATSTDASRQGQLTLGVYGIVTGTETKQTGLQIDAQSGGGALVTVASGELAVAAKGTGNSTVRMGHNALSSCVFSGYLSGTTQHLGIGFSCRNQYGGTDQNINARHLFVYDYAAAQYVFGVGPDRYLYYGSSHTTYGVRLAAGADNIVPVVVRRNSGTHSANLTDWRTSADAVLLAVASSGDLTFSDGVNLVFATTTGTKIGTAVTQKIGFYGATPIIQPTLPAAGVVTAADIRTALINLGLCQ